MEGPAARGIRKAGDLKGDRHDHSAWAQHPTEEWNVEESHQTCVGKCLFISKTCSEMSGGRCGRGSTGTVSISQRGLIPQVPGNLSGWHHHAGNQPRPGIHTQRLQSQL